MIDEADFKQNGKVDQDEFLQMMRKFPPSLPIVRTTRGHQRTVLPSPVGSEHQHEVRSITAEPAVAGSEPAK